MDFLEWEDADEHPFAQDVRIVLVSAEFSKELTTTVMWLNKREMDIICVRLKPYQDGGRLLIDVQQVLPLPEAADFAIKIKEKEVRERTARREQSASDDTFDLFWAGLQAQLVGRSELHANRKARGRWFGSPFIAPGVTLNYRIGVGGVPRVEAYIAPANGADAKQTFDALYTKKAEIEARFGRSLIWERGDGAARSKVYLVLKDLSVKDEATWDAVQDKFAQAMTDLEAALKPAFAALASQVPPLDRAD